MTYITIYTVCAVLRVVDTGGDGTTVANAIAEARHERRKEISDACSELGRRLISMNKRILSSHRNQVSD